VLTPTVIKKQLAADISRQFIASPARQKAQETNSAMDETIHGDFLTYCRQAAPIVASFSSWHSVAALFPLLVRPMEYKAQCEEIYTKLFHTG
jgi:hypothetical protein